MGAFTVFSNSDMTERSSIKTEFGEAVCRRKAVKEFPPNGDHDALKVINSFCMKTNSSQLLTRVLRR